MSKTLRSSVSLLSWLVLSACGAPSPAVAPATSAAELDPSSSASPGIDSPALALPRQALDHEPGPSGSAPPDGVIRRIPCKEGEADATCSERATRDALNGAPARARVLGVTVGADASSYRAALEIDGVVQMMDVATTDEVAAQAKELQQQGHRVTVKSVEAVSGAKRQRRALVVLRLTGE